MTMVLRSLHAPVGLADREALPASVQGTDDWLTLQQAACELNVSDSTIRRMLRKGRLRNRIVSRRGGYAYLIYLPDSRHAAYFGAQLDTRSLLRVVPRTADHSEAPAASFRDEQIGKLERQVVSLSEALTRALRPEPRPLSTGLMALAGDSGTFGSFGDAQRQRLSTLDPRAPYARYRALALTRRRRWWPF